MTDIKISIDRIRGLMDHRTNIRNMSVIAHVDHGKTTLSDALIRKAGISTKERWIDSVIPEQTERIITIKSTGVSLYFEMPREHLPSHLKDLKENAFLINMIDSPGHVDFSSEVTAALRLTDGALVVVDCVEGVAVQTETVLRQAIAERVKPVLMVNKLDRAIRELKKTPEEAYQLVRKAIGGVNAIIATYDDGKGLAGDLSLDPAKGNVAFGSGLHGWGFNIPMFARFYAAVSKKMSMEELGERLWGDWYWNDEKNNFTSQSKNEEGKPRKRTFVKFILEPIYDIMNGCLDNETKPNHEIINKVLKRFSMEISHSEKDLFGKDLMKSVLPRMIPAATALLEMMVRHLPSPAEAQKYRAGTLYSGPLDDKYCKAVMDCDPEGPLIVYVSKMVPSGKGRYRAFGRVFSGTVKPQTRVNIMGPNYVKGEKADFYTKKSIQGVAVGIGGIFLNAESCPAGNTIMLSGLDEFLLKSGTVVGTEEMDCYPMRNMRFSVTPVVRRAVAPKNPADLKKLKDGLVSLMHSDPLIHVEYTESGQTVVAGAGELHLEILLNDLKKMAGIEIVFSEPVVSFRETVSAKTPEPVLVKSPNKHNRLFIEALPIPSEVIELIDEKKVGPMDDPKARSEVLKPFGWDLATCKKIWAFGPDETGPNMLVETTKGVAYLSEIKDSLKAGLQWSTKAGALCEEPMRGIQFNFVDATLHADAIHRGQGQLLPAARRGFLGAQLCAEPQLLEPMFEVVITTPESGLGGTWSTITRRRGEVKSEEPKEGSPLTVIKAWLPVVESFGFDASLREATSGAAFPMMAFSHWQLVPGDPLKPGSLAGGLVTKTRVRKGLKEAIPSPDEYIDKM